MQSLSKKILLLIVKQFIRLHNLSYNQISVLALKINNGLHPKHRLLKYHKFFLKNIKKGDRVLDLGCGNGFLTFRLAQKAKFILGIDLNPKNIAFARKKFSAANIKYKVADITRIKKQNFDVIVLSNVLEHIPNRVSFLQKIQETAPKILLRVPLFARDWLTLYKKELNCEWRLDKTHYTEYNLNSLKKELKKTGLFLDKYSIQFNEIWAVVLSKQLKT